MDAPNTTPAGQPSFARLHGEACWHCGAATGPFYPVGDVALDDDGRSWPVVACAAHQGRRLPVAIRRLPPASSLTVQQQRGWRCVWCRQPLAVGYDVDLGEQRARPQKGAAYSWFPRACADRTACAGREQALE